jgi:hypothetical protein
MKNRTFIIKKKIAKPIKNGPGKEKKQLYIFCCKLVSDWLSQLFFFWENYHIKSQI